jgi:uncharacterized protein
MDARDRAHTGPPIQGVKTVDRRRASVLLIALALTAAAAVSGCTTSVTSVSGPAPDTVTVIGTGTGNAAPDRAQMSFSMSSQAKDRVSALNGASRLATAVIAAVKAAGVDAKDIRTTQVSVNEQRDPSGAKVIGFQAVESIGVTTNRLDQVGAIIAAATGAGATDVSGPDFSLSDSNAARLDAIRNAMADAKARAAATAQAAGRTLGPVVSVAQGEPAQPFSAAASTPGAALAPPISPGQLESQIQLTVVFSLK